MVFVGGFSFDNTNVQCDVQIASDPLYQARLELFFDPHSMWLVLSTSKFSVFHPTLGTTRKG